MNRTFLIILVVLVIAYFTFNYKSPKPVSKEPVLVPQQQEEVATGVPIDDVKAIPIEVESPQEVQESQGQNNEQETPQIKEEAPEPTYEPRAENSILAI